MTAFIWYRIEAITVVHKRRTVVLSFSIVVCVPVRAVRDNLTLSSEKHTFVSDFNRFLFIY